MIAPFTSFQDWLKILQIVWLFWITQGSSINDVTALGVMEYRGFCDDRDPRLIIERTIIERSIIDVFIIKMSFYRIVFYRRHLFPKKAGVQGAAAPWVKSGCPIVGVQDPGGLGVKAPV